MSELNQRWIKDECWISGCTDSTTHILETRVLTRATDPEYPVDPYHQEIGYCDWDAKEIAVALISKYDHEYEILDIREARDSDFE